VPDGEICRGCWRLIGVLWSPAVCAAISRNPARYSDTYYDPACVGGIPTSFLRIDGTLAGKPIHLHQNGMCGPRGIFAWYRLLRSNHDVALRLRSLTPASG
jgi:hypothetical protein